MANKRRNWSWSMAALATSMCSHELVQVYLSEIEICIESNSSKRPNYNFLSIAFVFIWVTMYCVWPYIFIQFGSLTPFFRLYFFNKKLALYKTRIVRTNLLKNVLKVCFTIKYNIFEHQSSWHFSRARPCRFLILFKMSGSLF